MAGLHIIILGAPGSGKGTQAARIAKEHGLKHLSTGDMLRAAVAAKTPLGLAAEENLKKGILHPDSMIVALVEEELVRLGNQGWIMDGFPRTLPQAEALAGILEKRGDTIDAVLLIDVPAETIVRRLSSRRVCPQCNAVYNLDSIKTKTAGRCDACGGPLVKRPDDEEATVRARLEVYEKQTAPLIEYYRHRDGLIAVDGTRGIDEITAEIRRVVKK